MKNIFTLLLLLNAATYSSFTQSVVPEWTRYHDISTTINYGINPFSHVDAEGNIIVCGGSYHPGPVIGMVTTKYSADGSWMWDAFHDTFALDFATSAVTDELGNVYMGGNSINPVTNLQQFVVYKYDGNTGNVLWEYRYGSGSDNERSIISKLLMLPDQRLIVVCVIFNSQLGSSQVTSIALDSDATPLWEYQHTPNNGATGALNAVLDTSGNIVLWGRGVANMAGEYGFLCIRLLSDGTLLSEHTTQPYSDDFQNGYHIDRQGNLYIGDYNGEYKITKYGTDGFQYWNYSKPYAVDPMAPLSSASLIAIETDSNGNVYTGGYYYSEMNQRRDQYYTVLSKDGIPVWENVFLLDSIRMAVSADAVASSNGNIAFTGMYVSDDSLGYFQPYIVWLNTSGIIQSGAFHLDGKRNSVAHISAGNSSVFVTGVSDFSDGSPHIRKQFVSKIAAPQVSGTSAPSRVQEMRAWPNPTSGSLQLSFYTTGTAGGTSAWAEIISTDGSVTLAESIPVQAGDNTCTLRSMERLPAGAYTVRVYVGREIFQGKVVRTEQK